MFFSRCFFLHIYLIKETKNLINKCQKSKCLKTRSINTNKKKHDINIFKNDLSKMEKGTNKGLYITVRLYICEEQ
jgi:hypothetical protein